METPPREGAPDPGRPQPSEPLWVDADWWREMLGAKDGGPPPQPPVAPSQEPALERDTSDEPVTDAFPAIAEVPAAPDAHEDAAAAAPQERAVPADVDGPPREAPEPPPAAPQPAEAPITASPQPPPAAAAAGAPATGEPAPPAVPRRRAHTYAGPERRGRDLHVPRVVPKPDRRRAEAPAEGLQRSAKAVLPPRPAAKAKSAAATPPVPPREGAMAIVAAAARRHAGDLALLLLAIGVITLVLLVLDRWPR